MELLEKKKVNKKILITGINPHCGEGGIIGNEEEKVIKPVIKNLRKKGFFIEGPFNSDDILKKYLERKAGGALFIYHDQLIPLLKFLDKKNNIVHLTWGLGFIRTSPTHGTAFDIAGKGLADETSMFEAIKEAFRFKI